MTRVLVLALALLSGCALHTPEETQLQMELDRVKELQRDQRLSRRVEILERRLQIEERKSAWLYQAVQKLSQH